MICMVTAGALLAETWRCTAPPLWRPGVHARATPLPRDPGRAENVGLPCHTGQSPPKRGAALRSMGVKLARPQLESSFTRRLGVRAPSEEDTRPQLRHEAGDGAADGQLEGCELNPPPQAICDRTALQTYERSTYLTCARLAGAEARALEARTRAGPAFTRVRGKELPKVPANE